MRDVDVHAIGVVVGNVLPVDGSRAQRHATLRNELLHSIRGDLIEVRRRHLLHARQPGLEAHEDEPHEDFLLERHQPMVLGMSSRGTFAVRHADQLAIEAVSPRVIGTRDASAQCPCSPSSSLDAR